MKHTDLDSEKSLERLSYEAAILKNKLSSIKTVLIVLSARALAFDRESLSSKVKAAYPGSQVFFVSTLAKAIGDVAPEQIDLVIDFTGPRQRHKWFFARKLRSRAKYLIGRNAGFFRPYSYDKIFDEFVEPGVPEDPVHKERFVQTRILECVGIPVTQRGSLLQDASHDIALELPRFKKA